MINKDEKGMIEIITPKVNENIIDSIAETNRVIADALYSLIDSNKNLTSALSVQPRINLNNIHIETKNSDAIGIKIGPEPEKETERFWFENEEDEGFIEEELLFNQREFK